MRYLWNMLNKEFTIEGAVSAFLVINMIGWMAATMGAGMLICKFLKFHEKFSDYMGVKYRREK